MLTISTANTEKHCLFITLASLQGQSPKKSTKALLRPLQRHFQRTFLDASMQSSVIRPNRTKNNVGWRYLYRMKKPRFAE